jgi:hypothetical protein
MPAARTAAKKSCGAALAGAARPKEMTAAAAPTRTFPIMINPLFVWRSL